MKTLVRIAVAGALMAGYATAQAQSLPSSGSADLWLFVSDQSAKTTFAEDTGVSLSSLLPGPYVGGAQLNASMPANFTVAASTALTNYISSANSAGQTLEWAVLGSQYGVQNPSDPSNQVAGAAISVFDGATAATTNSKVKALQLAATPPVARSIRSRTRTSTFGVKAPAAAPAARTCTVWVSTRPASAWVRRRRFTASRATGTR